MRFRPLLETLHVLALSLWLGGLLMAGAGAAVIFPTMRALAPRSPVYEKYEGEHWLIIGGHAANRLFILNDAVQLACAGASVLTLGFVLAGVPRGGGGESRAGLGVRAALLSVAVGLVCYQLFSLAPEMSGHLKAYWLAAEEGRAGDAVTHQAAFDALHPRASNVLSATALAVLGSLIATAWMLASRRERT